MPKVFFRSKRLPPSEGKVHRLKHFAKKYSSFFPLSVLVEQGHYDPQLHCEVSAGDIYTLKSISTARSIVVKDRSGTQKIIPTSSHVEYAFLYNPDGDMERARGGYVFATVRDILDRRTRPTVVIATLSYEGGSEEASVEQSEILVVLKPKRRGVSESSLAVYSVTLGMAKLLPSSCRGDFSTNPYSTKLRITEILDHLNKNFPVKACLYIAPEFEEEVESYLIEEPLDVLGVVSVSCVVATFSTHDNESRFGVLPSGTQLVELPLHIPITVSLHIHKDPHRTRMRPQEVKKTSRGKSKTFDPPLVKEGSDYQALFETEVGSDPLYDCVVGRNPTSGNRSSEVSPAATIVEKCLKDTSDMVGVLVKEMRSLRSYVECRITTLQSSESQAAVVPMDVQGVPADSKLSLLSVQQVCFLLDSLDLPQYKAIVKTERISGGVLSRLTEDDLRIELKMTSRIHRLRLMNVIDGRVSIDVPAE